jgi:hypothetical protein
MADESYDITDDSELKVAVRDATDYQSTDILSEAQLQSRINSAKRILATELELPSPDFYADRGLTLALEGIACIEAKCAVENEAVAQYDFGGGVTVEARDSKGNSLQTQRYEHRITKGLAKTNVSQPPQRMLHNTTGYIG